MFMVLLKNLLTFLLTCLVIIMLMKMASNDSWKMNTGKMTGSGLTSNLRIKELNPTKNRV